MTSFWFLPKSKFIDLFFIQIVAFEPGMKIPVIYERGEKKRGKVKPMVTDHYFISFAQYGYCIRR